MVVVADDERRERLRRLRSHAMTATTIDRQHGRAVGYEVVDCGYNFRMDELRAALGLVQIARLSEWNRGRVELLGYSRAALAREVPQVRVPFDPGHPTSGHILPIVLPSGGDRAAVMSSMRAAGVQTSVHYPAIHEFDYYRRRIDAGALPHTERFSRQELTLPLHPALTRADVDRVVVAVREALEATGSVRGTV